MTAWSQSNEGEPQKLSYQSYEREPCEEITWHMQFPYSVPLPRKVPFSSSEHQEDQESKFRRDYALLPLQTFR